LGKSRFFKSHWKAICREKKSPRAVFQYKQQKNMKRISKSVEEKPKRREHKDDRVKRENKKRGKGDRKFKSRCSSMSPAQLTFVYGLP